MQAGDWKSLQAAYQQQARILFVEGRPHRHVAQEATRARLMCLLELGVVGVKVMTVDDERVWRTLPVARRQGIHYPKSLGGDAHTRSKLHRW